MLDPVESTRIVTQCHQLGYGLLAMIVFFVAAIAWSEYREATRRTRARSRKRTT